MNKHRSNPDRQDNPPAEDSASGEAGQAVAPDSSESVTVFADLEDRLAKLEAERNELRSTMVRRQADFENYKKRVERERHEEGRRGVMRLAENLLPVLDGFERALAAHNDPAYEDYRAGFELIYRQLWEALARHGLERVVPKGQPFDPHFHQAIDSVETDEHAEGVVVEVLQPGYLFHGRMLRPATVRVAVAPANESKKQSH